MTITREMFVEMVEALHAEVEIRLQGPTSLALIVPTRSEPDIEALARTNGLRYHPTERTPINSIIRLYGFAGFLEPAEPRRDKTREFAEMVRAMAEDAKQRRGPR